MSSAVMQDAESLLPPAAQDEEQAACHARERRMFVKRAAAGLCIIVIASGAVAAVTSGKATAPKAANAVVGLFAVPDDCFKRGMYYSEPSKLEGTERTVERSAEDCQARCRNVDGCSQFTYWPDGGCLLTGEGAVLKAVPLNHADTVTGPKSCESLAEHAIQAESASKHTAAGINGTQCSAYPACVAAGITEGNCCPNDEDVSLGCCNGPAAALETALAGILSGLAANGTKCSAYPVCVALNLNEGSCCPNADGVVLGCCNGIPPPKTEPASIIPEPVDNGPVSAASCSLAPNCAALKLEGNCCPNDAGNSLGCCPGGGASAPAQAAAIDVPSDSKQRCENNAGCAESKLEGLCCPNPGNITLGCCDSVMDALDAQLGGMFSPPVLKPAAASPGPLMTFYMYRVDNDQKYVLNGVNMANLDGDMWYLHNEVVASCPRKFGITRMTRFKVTMRATKELAGQGKNFDSFVAFDKAKCTVPGCAQLHWDPLGYVVGCQPNDKGRVAVPGQPAWYSLPGTCPSKFYYQKSAQCVAAEPGGRCADVTGSKTCTYSIEEAGEIRLDDISGIQNYNEVCQTQGLLEYDEQTDKGNGTSFWNGKANADKGAARFKHIETMFASRFPQWPAHLDDPPCDA